MKVKLKYRYGWMIKHGNIIHNILVQPQKVCTVNNSWSNYSLQVSHTDFQKTLPVMN